MKLKGFFILATLVVGGMPVFGQKADFSGNWGFKDQQSVSGKLYSNGSPKDISIQQAAGELTITRVTAGQNGDVTASETLSFDGKAFVGETGSHRKKVATLSWSADQQIWTEVTHSYDLKDTTKVAFTVTDVYMLQNGELVLNRKAENGMNGEVWESKATYDKE